MTCEEVRLSLGAYTLGALDPEEALEIEVHLASCEGCTDELMELEGVSSFLAKVSERDVELVARPPREVLDRLLNDRVKRHRRGRILLAVAASVAVLAVGGTVWTTTHQELTATVSAPAADSAGDAGQGAAPEATKAPDAAPERKASQEPEALAKEEPSVAADMPSATPAPKPSESDAMTLKAQGTAFRGHSADGKVVAMVTVTPGMPLQVQVGGVPAGTECTLVVVSKGGGREFTRPWKVTVNHYEEGAAVFPVESRTPQASIRAFEIRNDAGRLLVTVNAK
ncbi:zf-HC2 domain-containing protein [Nonomuraea mangrovi]|uniref:Zf-HC2 domain-containing protein n=1 Tax=Nonomuraea mangrovi TaxID=2316207 RepID=A0ABW4SQS2_9ACTN